MLATRACGKQAYLRFLDAVLGLAALAVQIVVEGLWFTREVAHYVARVVTLLAILQPCDHPAFFGPGFCGIQKLTHLALFAPRGLKFLLHCPVSYTHLTLP